VHLVARMEQIQEVTYRLQSLVKCGYRMSCGINVVVPSSLSHPARRPVSM